MRTSTICLSTLVSVGVLATSCATAPPSQRSAPPPAIPPTPASRLSPEEVHDIARDAYVFGLPMVENYKIFALSFASESKKRTPPNVFWHSDQLFTAEDRDVVSPNTDTLYSKAILDLRAEPVIIQTPAMGDRYYAIQLVDIVTNNLPYIGTRTTGKEAGAYVIAGPDWDGTLPARAEQLPVIRSPSRFVVALGRTAVNGPSDFEVAHSLQRQIVATPLSTFATQMPPPPAPVVTWPPTFDPKTDDTELFFGYVNLMMQWHRFEPQEATTLARFGRIGVKPGDVPSFDELTAEQRAAMRDGIREARQLIQQPTGVLRNGWQMPDPRVGDFGTDYLLRAKTAWSYLYENSPAEAIYPVALKNGDGGPLDGRERYTVTFPATDMPPARFFWSLTMYDASSHMLVSNPAQRYSIGDRTRGLEMGPDGSLTVYLQRESPKSQAQAANWLPTPSGNFYLILRIYGPSEAAQRGGYSPPSVERVSGAVGRR